MARALAAAALVPPSRRPAVWWRRPARPAALVCRSVGAGGAPAGLVSLVGAGPGSTDHLTLKAARLLAGADVVLYDDLGAQDAVDELAAQAAERVYVGKRGKDGEGAPFQRSIEEQLVKWCREGKRVVRLKGGCPSVFGRTNSEIAALEEAGCAWELVPGVSSALAGPLLAGIPLTDRDLGRSFLVASAHDPAALDWEGMRGADTLVLLMGGRRLVETLARLVEAGRGGGTPVAVVRAAGTADQREWRGTLETIAGVVEGEELSPFVLVVGEVCRGAAKRAAKRTAT